MDRRPAFLITIDTEGDNLWAGGTEVRTENVERLRRFQALCERFGQKPTYLTNFEMVSDPRFVAFGRDVIDRKVGEIGMHLHAWHSPPAHELCADAYRRMPYLIEYPTPVLKAKVREMTARLEDAFGRKMVSHRAGRWALDERYAACLIEEGYLVDCSVTPYVSWRASLGDPAGKGGTDYRHFPDDAYFLDPEDISRPGASPLLELPMTIAPRGRLSSRNLPGAVYANGLTSRLANRLAPNDWLRPRGGNGRRMVALIERRAAEGRAYVEFMTHSSELMPGGGPYFADEAAIDGLYADLEAVFQAAQGRFVGHTLHEFRQRYA